MAATALPQKDPSAPDQRGGLARELAVAWLHLAALWCFAFAWPLFEVLQDSPEFFVARDNTNFDIVALALAATLVAPTVLVACEALLFPFARARRALHLAFVGVLIAAIVLQIVGHWGSPPWILPVGASILAGAAGAYAYRRTRFLPSTLSVLSPVPLLAVLFFLLVSPVSDLLFSSDEGSKAATGAGDSTPVVMVVFDEFDGSSLTGPNGRIDASRFPHFAALADDATWYRNATTAADQTSFAVPAVLSGRRPKPDELPIVADYPRNLFTALGSRYHFNVSEPLTDLCPERLCGSEKGGSARDRLRALFDDLTVVSEHLLLPERLREGLPAVDRAFTGFRAPGRDKGRVPPAASFKPPVTAPNKRTARFERFLSGITPASQKPQLDFAHVEFPHARWEYLPGGQIYPVTGLDMPGIFADTWVDDPWLTMQAEQRYLLQVGYADRLIGRLLARLRSVGLYDEALIVVTADHGVSFRPGGTRRTATPENLPDIANVPLFVKEPLQRSGRVDNGPASTIDVLPTVLRAAGLRSEGRMDGRPLPRPPGSRPELRVEAFGHGSVVVPFQTFVRERDEQTRRRISLLGAGDGFAEVYAAGPYKGILGLSPADVGVAGTAPFHVDVDPHAEFFAYSPGASTVPALITGRLSKPGQAQQVIAVAINDRIAAVTRSYQFRSEMLMDAVVPPSAFKRGANRVEVFAVGGPESRPRLAAAGRVSGTTARLVKRNGAFAVDGVAGKPIRVAPGAIDGNVDTVQLEGNRLVVAGWVTDARHTRPADRVLVFSGDRLLQATQPQLVRNDVAKLGPGGGSSGFYLSRSGVPEDVAPERLRVIAVVGDRASEMSVAAPG